MGDVKFERSPKDRDRNARYKAMLRTLIKRLFLVLGIIVTLPLILLCLLEELLCGRDCERVYGFGKELLAAVPTIIGEYLRLGFYRCVCSHISVDVALMYNSMLAHRDVTIGPGVVVGVGTIIGKAVIEEGVLFGARVSLLSGKYQHGRPGVRVLGAPKGEFASITIGAHSWIGQQSVVMANVGRGCTIGAGSVLMKDAPDNTTFMGNPARKVNIEPKRADKDYSNKSEAES